MKKFNFLILLKNGSNLHPYISKTCFHAFNLVTNELHSLKIEFASSQSLTAYHCYYIKPKLRPSKPKESYRQKISSHIKST